MSYKSEYNMQWPGEVPTIEEVVTYAVTTLDGIPEGNPGWSERHDLWEKRVAGGAWEEWREHQLDLSWISRNWPDTRFELKIVGDDPGDLHLEYHLNGLVQEVRANRTFPELNPAELVKPVLRNIG